MHFQIFPNSVFYVPDNHQHNNDTKQRLDIFEMTLQLS